MDIYIDGTESRAEIIKNAMDVYIAGDFPWEEQRIYTASFKKMRPKILESFIYVNQYSEENRQHCSKFMLDSGAFSFMTKSKGNANWDEYIEQYADYINKHGVELFFELDVDNVVGYKKVLEMRARLERLTNKRCIPVWHKSRGVQEFLREAEQYDYVAIGGIVSKEIKEKEYHLLPSLIREAHKRDAKIHGLGFTNLKWLELCHFDSVDSTNWTAGNRFGFAWHFTGKTIKQIRKGQGKIKDPKQLAVHNFVEWCKFSKYAETHL